jgi:serine/threonine protein kinase
MMRGMVKYDWKFMLYRFKLISITDSYNQFKSTKQRMSIEQFKLLKKVGSGNYGVAYKAIDTQTNEEVCVKVFKP